MGKFIDLTGQKFGRLTAIERTDNNKYNHTCWLCRCECLTECIVEGYRLTSGHTQSCGCLHSEISSKIHASHKQSKTRLYIAWTSMKNRCSNPKYPKYDDWGGRGIRVCSQWSEFEPFMEWSLSHGYSEDLSIDRIDVDGDYTPDNCRWVARIEQARNTRTYLTNKSGCPGVRWYKRYNKWCAKIGVNGKDKHIGYFTDKDDAIAARMEAELKYWG